MSEQRKVAPLPFIATHFYFSVSWIFFQSLKGIFVRFTMFKCMVSWWKIKKNISRSINSDLHATSVLQCRLCSYLLKATWFHHYLREIKGSPNKMSLLQSKWPVYQSVTMQMYHERTMTDTWSECDMVKRFSSFLLCRYCYYVIEN